MVKKINDDFIVGALLGALTVIVIEFFMIMIYGLVGAIKAMIS